ncbi:MAG: hypothetical protein ACKOZU_05925 [Planctomycetaceae bacterium]
MTARALPLCAAALAWAAVATAAPLDLAAVPAKAQWVMHLDMDAARESTVLKRAWERAMKMHPQAEQMMKMGAGMMGMDPRKDLRDVTAWGLDTDKHNGVMIVRAKANREMLEKMVAKAPDHETMEHRKYTLHAWTHKGWKGHKGEKVVGAFHRDDVTVFARTPDQVKAALDVLDSDAKSAAEDGPLGGRVKPGSILVARAAAVDPETKCPVLRQGRAFRVAIGESEGMSFYRVKLDMKSDEAADQAEDVVEGFAAVARLRWGDEAAAMKLVDGLETKSEGSTCMISWDAPVDGVWTVVETMADRWEQKRKEWMRSHGGKRDAGQKSCCKSGCGKSDCEGCEKCPAECPMKKGGSKQAEEPLRDDEF